MCSNTLCGAPHSGKGVSKLRGSYGRININYQLVITRYSSKPPPRKRCSLPSTPERVLPPPCTYSNAGAEEEEPFAPPLPSSGTGLRGPANCYIHSIRLIAELRLLLGGWGVRRGAIIIALFPELWQMLRPVEAYRFPDNSTGWR